MNQVAVIIINYNSSDYTIACVKSILEQTAVQLKYEIIVVDNNSDNTDYEKLILGCKGLQNLSIHRSIINLGFAGGNMFGLQFANAAYCYFLNNDCELLNDNLSQLYAFMQQNKGVAIATGQMHDTDLSFHHSFSYFPSIGLKLFGSAACRLFSPERYPDRKLKYTVPVQVPLVTGAAMFIDLTKLAEVGGFDTTFFLFCEEEDIARKMTMRGYTCFLVPAAKFVHHMGKSTKRNDAIARENYISLLYYHRKYNNYLVYTLFKLFYTFKSIKRFYKGLSYVRLATFILAGAPMRASLKHIQKIRRP